MCCGFVVSSLGYEKLSAYIIHVMLVYLRNIHDMIDV